MKGAADSATGSMRPEHYGLRFYNLHLSCGLTRSRFVTWKLHDIYLRDMHACTRLNCSCKV